MMISGWVTQLKKGVIEYCVLKRLGRGESYGYEIVQGLKAMDEVAITESIVYPILSRLRREGYLRVRAVKSSEGPPRRYYALTALGHRRLRAMDEYWRELCRAVEGMDRGRREEG